MLLRHLGRALTIVGALAVSACQSLVDFSDWAAGYDKAVERTHNENVLINMVRAAYNRPLHFATIAVVRGNGQVSPAIQGFFPFVNFSAPARSGATLTPSIGVTSGFNFDLASLDNSEFITGLLTPISPATVHFYVMQGIPRELLFSLFIERVTITANNRTETYINDPNDPRYDAFVATLQNLLELGFTTENPQIMMPFGPALTTQEAKDPLRLQAAAQAGLILQPTPVGSEVHYQLMRAINYPRFCFTGGAPNMPRLPQSVMCGSLDAPGAGAAPQPGSQQNFQSGSGIAGFENASLSVVIRSTRDVFNFVGNLIYQQVERPVPHRLILTSQEAKNYNYLGRGDELIVVRKNQTRPGDLVRVDFEGNTYSIPAENQGNSALVMSVIQQILNLSKSVNLIPTTSAVVVR
ncbi:MAG: hypothetical protein FJX55_06605 [Alphaproteobacteria bacterium]|nr:hypothetical protein [Alphaproteobacteria bacterium]